MIEVIIGLLGVILFVAILIALGFGMTILNGWVFTKLWAWIIVPFFGLPLLPIPIAIGIVFISTFLTHQSDTSETLIDEEDEEKKKKKQLFQAVTNITKPFAFLLFGWILSHWIDPNMKPVFNLAPVPPAIEAPAK